MGGLIVLPFFAPNVLFFLFCPRAALSLRCGQSGAYDERLVEALGFHCRWERFTRALLAEEEWMENVTGAQRVVEL